VYALKKRCARIEAPDGTGAHHGIPSAAVQLRRAAALRGPGGAAEL
jgi:hypothetical protein